jgi:PAS domain S-box-containing protein
MGSPEAAEPNRFFAQLAAFVSLAVGILLFAGWTFGIDALTNFIPGWPRVSRITALGFLLGGAALWSSTVRRQTLSNVASSALIAIGLLVLLRYMFSWDAYIDQFSLRPVVMDDDGRYPPRMAPSTACLFILLGVSMLCASSRRTAVAHQALATVVVIGGWMGFSRYAFGGEPLIPFVNVAAHASLVFILLGVGALTLRTDIGIAKLLVSDGVGGSMARRLLPAAVVVPLLAGLLALYFERSGSIPYEAAINLFALIGVIAFAILVLLNAERSERADRRRRDAENALRGSEERNQLIVETSLDAVVTMNRHGLVHGWNSQAERVFGWTRAEAIGRDLAELIIPEARRADHRLGMRRYLETGIARILNRRVELMALHARGHEFPVEFAVTPIGFGEDLVFSAFIRDITGRTRAEAALRESEQRFRSTANSAPVLIWMSGADKKCTWFNQRWLDFVGRAMEQELGDGWCDNLHPADFDRALDTYHAAFDARRPYEMEYRLQRDDGAWRWLLERGTPNMGPAGEFEGYIGTCIDITEHRETLEQLRESRARFKTLTESLPQMIYTCLRDGNCDYLSRQWLDYTGRSEAQQLGSGWLEQLHPDDRVQVQLEWSRVIGSGDTFDTVCRIRRFDGAYRWFKTRAVPLRDPAGRILKWFGSHTDIEDSVVASSKLQVQLERMHLLDRTTHAIGTHQQEVRKVFEVVLSNLEDDLGVEFCCISTYHTEPELLTVASVGSRSGALAQQMGLVEQAGIEVDANALARCVRGELVYEPDVTDSRLPFPARLATGGLRALVAAPLMIESEVFGVLVVAKREAASFTSDDCEFLRQLSSHIALAAHQGRLYGALQEAYQDLRQTQQTVMQQERLRALGQIASGIAHDINNALSPAALYTQSMLTHEAKLSERAREQLVVIQRAIEDVAHTVQRMRAFYLPSGFELTLTPVNVNQHVLEVVDLTRARWSNMPQERGIVVEVETRLQPDLPHILGAESELRDALTNLLLNAVDALPEGGLVTMRTRVDARDEHVILEVEDNGIGMTETTRSRCLEPFFTTKGERGTGLGLSMVFGMAQRHGGELEIESELGRGTLMRLTFPKSSTALTARERSLDAPARKLRILLVDDDPMLLRSLRDALELDEHEVVTAEGGQLGIDAFSAEIKSGRSFDAVITDLGMPHVDGRKVATKIRAMGGNVPIIMLTGWGHRLIATADQPEHVDRVLSKPPKMAELRSTLAELVREKK